MILVWLIAWLIENQPHVQFSPDWNGWAIFLVISIILA